MTLEKDSPETESDSEEACNLTLFRENDYVEFDPKKPGYTERLMEYRHLVQPFLIIGVSANESGSMAWSPQYLKLLDQKGIPFRPARTKDHNKPIWKISGYWFQKSKPPDR